ncbi:MAG: hypothetical protein H6779_01275 [Candidatus Nomurabacteria bacterium]|nr:MAG: hypothetical protein H6779_01275 [Candidatus Nomurabacteria bacterium]
MYIQKECTGKIIRSYQIEGYDQLPATAILTMRHINAAKEFGESISYKKITGFSFFPGITKHTTWSLTYNKDQDSFVVEPSTNNQYGIGMKTGIIIIILIFCSLLSGYLDSATVNPLRKPSTIATAVGAIIGINSSIASAIFCGILTFFVIMFTRAKVDVEGEPCSVSTSVVSGIIIGGFLGCMCLLILSEAGYELSNHITMNGALFLTLLIVLKYSFIISNGLMGSKKHPSLST